MNNKLLLIIMLVATLQVTAQKTEINTVVDAWHKAAADADFDAYFDLMTKDGVFIGTDATENWQNKDFKAFSKPYFDKGKAWSFTALERNVYVDKSKKIAWFDELLDTQMEICRGSGILKKVKGEWKIAHYVLSIAIPNEDVDKVVALKKEKDIQLKKELKQN
ncbi:MULTISPECIES: nuclear transport factor 2 family protein [unclassified Cellulophaga]|uniref:nuclear transport factor 2 family protein n=1 Tax=unclassified Cellulophaga TaxID=2634405 RepID=UPI0026E31346|nr:MULTISPECIES: nuclear transport factor 2 family protein [unclassified Cellulophaga]MDO6489958.1 nuclear transport factor 2 family protein [Cellulophaga sp. 2_MG-2023]MDO6494848.1 nuclear transport factor 2 family protein [Cellulophaga sp. 3_MG-2023]